MAGGEPRLGITWMNMHTRVPQTAGANKNTNAIYMPTIRGLDARNSCDLTHLRQSQARSSGSRCGRLGRVKRQMCRLLASAAAPSAAAVSGCHLCRYHRSLRFVQVPAVEVER